MQLPAHHYLDERQIAYERRSFPPTTDKGAANVAAALGYRERQMIKTLIFEVVDTGEHLLVMVGADQNIKSGLLKKAAGSRNIRLAAPEAVYALTGYRIGSIPPFGWQPPGFRTLLEATLLSEAILGVGAGQWGEEILITPANLLHASQAVAAPLCEATP
ncbi:MAG: YbaK/EbsC family protein [Anaerolineae bacterium]|jgi:Cys-tRNA(Pro)/Cys-tRNA(Cys) deacylase|nr:YbaK/EbsC family protein [Anaerolineae bacterium]